MTLIVGFRCGDSVVLCADSQETRGLLKSNVNKLPIQAAVAGGMDIVCGGAGNGDLSDSFRSSLTKRMVRSPKTGEEPIRLELEAALVDFHRSKVFAAYPVADPNDKYISGLISVRSAAREVFLYKYDGSVVQPVATYQLAGEEYSYFGRILQRRYRPGLSINQAMIIGLEVIGEGRETSTGIGGPTRIVIATPNGGMRCEQGERLAWAEAELTKQNELFDSLRFELGSTGAQVQDQLTNFSNSITALRGVYGSKYEAWPKLTIGHVQDDDKDRK